MNILGTGMSGLIGTRVCRLLSSYKFQNLSLETGVDITDPRTVEEYFSKSDAPWVFHFAAKTDVDNAEKERRLGVKSGAYIVNVMATGHIVEACRQTGKKILYVSTDFVFDGTKDHYTEADAPNPKGWYAQTKYEGEKLVGQLPQSLIIRIANPYGVTVDVRPDFVHKIMMRLASGAEVTAPDDQIFLPTFIDDIAFAIGKLISADARGIYHVVGSGPLSPFDVATKIAGVFGYDKKLVKPVSFADFFNGRAPRPFRAVLKNDKIAQLGVRMCTFDEGLAKIDASESGKKSV